jgi:hypothetical protein
MSAIEDDPDYRNSIYILEAIQAKYYHSPYNDFVSPDYTDEEIEQSVSRISELAEQSADSRYARQVRAALSDEQTEKTLTKFEEPVYHRTLRTHRELIESLIKINFSDFRYQIILSSAPTGRFNGVIMSGAGERYKIILLENGIFGMCIMLSKILVSLTKFCRRPPMFRNEADFSFNPLRQLERNPVIRLRFVDLAVSYVCRGSPYKAKPYMLPVNRQKMQSFIFECMSLFVTAHEYGHVISESFSSAAGGEQNKQTIFAQEQELEADAFAIEIVIAYATLVGFPREIAYASIEALFHFIEILEKVFNIYQPGLSEYRRSLAHPEPGTRVWSIRRHSLKVLGQRIALKKCGPPCKYYHLAFEEMFERSAVLMRAVAKDLDAPIHPKWQPGGLT